MNKEGNLSDHGLRFDLTRESRFRWHYRQESRRLTTTTIY